MGGRPTPTEGNEALTRRYFEEYHAQRAETILADIVAADLFKATRSATERLRAAFPRLSARHPG